MAAPVYHIPFSNLLLALIPAGIVMAFFVRWKLPAGHLLYAVFRMFLQLILVGFALVFIFESNSAVFVTLVLSVMLAIASWIALRPLSRKSFPLYSQVFISLLSGCGLTLILLVLAVLHLSPWYQPQYLIPIAGMIFANSMNAVSLAAERFQAERRRSVPLLTARGEALQAALLPTINTLFAVGLVSFPGMMTGQILAGVSPLIAVRYQVMIMAGVLGASGISAVIFLSLRLKQSTGEG